MMNAPIKNPALRQGQFIWMDEGPKNRYIEDLKRKIKNGFYSSEKVIAKIVEEIAPVVNDTLDHDDFI